MHKRTSPRLKNYDYTLPGGYFVTLCSFQRLPIFGEICDYTMALNDVGSLAIQVWDSLPAKYDNIILDARVVMPNHFHGLLIIEEQKNYGLTQFIGWYKYQTTKMINQLWGTWGKQVWQRSFHDSIIRKPEDLVEYREYILGNPAQWAEDEYNRV